MATEVQLMAETFNFLAGGGEMGRLIREFDWSAHRLGKPEVWPQSLKTAISLILNSQHPMWIGWGQEMSFLYNDAYLHVLGLAKHPKALGRPACEVWAEIWDVCGPLADKVFRRGEASFVDDVRLFMQRGEYLEETYYSFSYSPIRDESGGVGGLFCPSTDTTPKVVGARRLRTLSELAGGAYAGELTEAACAMLAHELAKNPDDVPFALLYLANDEGTQAVLKQSVRLDRHDETVAPPLVDLTASGDATMWPLSEVFQTKTWRQISLGRPAAFPLGPADQPVCEAMILPMVSRGDDKPLGVLIAGMNPTRRADAGYTTFFELVATQVGTVIQNARVTEDEKRRADMLEEIDRAKTAFFSNVSHEFRTPLTLMIGTLEDSLASGHIKGEERERLEVAHRNSLRLLKLVNSLLDFSRIEAGRAQATYQPTDLAALSMELASNFRSACDRAGLKLVVDCPPLAEPVYVDRGMWEKIVLNLLSNAFKFTFEGEIAVRLRESGGEAELVVSDSGVGIPPHELVRVFERFHRIAGQKSRSYEGSGIGLALVQELVKLHGGGITADSVVGRGTSFTIRLPFGTAHLPKEHVETSRTFSSTPIRADAYVEEALLWLSDGGAAGFEESARDTHSAGELRGLGTGTRILLADDNADMRGYIRRLLQRSCDVEAVGDGYEALEAIRVQRPDLIISDVMMPNLDGFGLLRAIRSHEEWREIPVILLSARAGEESRVEGLQAGADDYLVKPFSARELSARVSSLLELTRVRRDAMTALRESEQRMRALFRQAPGFICILRGPNHVFEFANESYMRLVGARELTGKTLREAIPEVEGQEFLELLDRVYHSGEPFSGLETPLKLRRSAQGPLVQIVVDFIYQPITDADGRVTGIFVEGFDVTDRVQAQGALRESETRYRTLFESIDEGFCIMEAMGGGDDVAGDYLCIAANPALKVQSGLTVNVGKDTVRGVLGDEAQTWVELFDQVRRSGESARGERNLATLGLVLDLYCFRLEDESRQRVGIIFTDVTERKRAEAELLRANQDLQQFAYSASHDLQEPLRSVKIYSELLAQRYGDKLEGQAKDFLEFLRAGASRMEMLVRDLLNYTQAGQHEKPDEPVDTEQALQDALANLAAAIKTTDARVTYDRLPRVRVHATQLQQIFQNLIGNAIKYRRAEVTPAIHVGVVRDNDCWLFSISDNGLGIEAEYKERIFGLFKRLHTGDQYSGTGIGLAICQRIVERAQGRIWVESTPRKGSTFYFTIAV